MQIADFFARAKINGFRSLFFLLVFFCTPKVSLARHLVGDIEEIKLPSFKWHVVMQDAPFSRVMFEGCCKIWMLGKQAVWLWNIDDQELKRLVLRELPDTENNRFQTMSKDDYSFFTASNNEVHQIIRHGKRSIWRFKSPFSQPKTIALLPAGDLTYWVQDQGIVLLDRYGKRSRTVLKKNLASIRHAVLTPLPSHQIWLSGKKRLWKLDMGKRVPQVAKVSHIKQNWRTLHSLGGSVLSATAYAMMVFSRQGKLIQTVPISAKRKLITADLTDQFHSYLFRDKLLQVFDVTKDTTWNFKVPVHRVRKVQSLRIQPPFVAFIADGKPRVFMLPKF